MKKAILHLVTIMGICTLLYSCNKSQDNTTFSSTPSVTASITESAFTATLIDASISKKGDTSNLNIRAFESTSNRTIFLKVINFQSASGTYSIDSPGVQAMAYYQKGSVVNYGKVGSVKIYNVTQGVVQGTFTFSMKDATKINDIQVTGKFTVVPIQ